jgi:hypothetical protein
MDGGVAVFIVVMTSMVALAVIILTWMNNRHRLAAIKAAADGRPDPGRQIELLSDENAGLRGQVGRLEERIAVLERIATDPAERTALEIERLR